jgi:hypothetical protein
MIRRTLAGLLVLSSILASSDAIADLRTGSEKLPAQGAPAQQEKKADADERFIAQFRATTLTPTQAIAVAERFHLGSRTAAVTFEVSDRDLGSFDTE